MEPYACEKKNMGLGEKRGKLRRINRLASQKAATFARGI